MSRIRWQLSIIERDGRPVLWMVIAACLPNVTGIGNWLRPYGSKKTYFFLFTTWSRSTHILQLP